MGHVTGDAALDAIILGASALCSSGAALLWWSLRRNIAAIDERQRASDAIDREQGERLSDYHARLAVVEDRLSVRHE